MCVSVCVSVCVRECVCVSERVCVCVSEFEAAHDWSVSTISHYHV